MSFNQSRRRVFLFVNGRVYFTGEDEKYECLPIKLFFEQCRGLSLNSKKSVFVFAQPYSNAVFRQTAPLSRKGIKNVFLADALWEESDGEKVEYGTTVLKTPSNHWIVCNHAFTKEFVSLGSLLAEVPKVKTLSFGRWLLEILPNWRDKRVMFALDEKLIVYDSFRQDVFHFPGFQSGSGPWGLEKEFSRNSSLEGLAEPTEFNLNIPVRDMETGKEIYREYQRSRKFEGELDEVANLGDSSGFALLNASSKTEIAGYGLMRFDAKDFSKAQTVLKRLRFLLSLTAPFFLLLSGMLYFANQELLELNGKTKIDFPGSFLEAAPTNNVPAPSKKKESATNVNETIRKLAAFLPEDAWIVELGFDGENYEMELRSLRELGNLARSRLYHGFKGDYNVKVEAGAKENKAGSSLYTLHVRLEKKKNAEPDPAWENSAAEQVFPGTEP